MSGFEGADVEGMRTLQRRMERAGRAIADSHELSARHIALILPGALPKTTSGKIQRKFARRLWLDRGFEEIG